MEWIKRIEKPPEKEHKHILIACTQCNHVHSAMWDYGEWGMAECCDERGPYFHGCSVEFDLWSTLPDFPKYSKIS